MCRRQSRLGTNTSSRPIYWARFSLIQYPCDVTALRLATPRGLCRAIRQPSGSGAGIDSGCSSLKFGFEAAGPIYLSDFFIPGSTFGGGVSLGDRKPNIGRKYALVPGLTTPLYNVTLALFEEVPPTL